MRFAREVGDKLVFMHQGRVHEVGDPKEVFANPQTADAGEFHRDRGGGGLRPLRSCRDGCHRGRLLERSRSEDAAPSTDSAGRLRAVSRINALDHCALAAAFDRGTMSRLSTETPDHAAIPSQESVPDRRNRPEPRNSFHMVVAKAQTGETRVFSNVSGEGPEKLACRHRRRAPSQRRNPQRGLDCTPSPLPPN